MIVNLQIVWKGQSMVNRNQICNFLCSLGCGYQFLNYENIGLISITVQYSNIQNSYLMNFVHIELM